ncbi:MAG: tetratricopeptide repeat protein [Minicystis sp.]
MSSKRLAVLEKMTASGTKDPFAWYGLAMEYKGLGRHDEAIATFGKLRDLDAGYVPQYLMCGSLLLELGRKDEAREWLTQGIATARAKGDSHALSELESALAGA